MSQPRTKVYADSRGRWVPAGSPDAAVIYDSTDPRAPKSPAEDKPKAEPVARPQRR